jgi:hypothetical protein
MNTRKIFPQVNPENCIGDEQILLFRKKAQELIGDGQALGLLVLLRFTPCSAST